MCQTKIKCNLTITAVMKTLKLSIKGSVAHFMQNAIFQYSRILRDVSQFKNHSSTQRKVTIIENCNSIPECLKY